METGGLRNMLSGSLPAAEARQNNTPTKAVPIEIAPENVLALCVRRLPNNSIGSESKEMEKIWKCLPRKGNRMKASGFRTRKPKDGF